MNGDGCRYLDELERDLNRHVNEAKRLRREYEELAPKVWRAQFETMVRCVTDMKRFCEICDVRFGYVLDTFAYGDRYIDMHGLKMYAIIFDQYLDRIFKMIMNTLDSFVWTRLLDDGDHAIAARVLSFLF